MASATSSLDPAPASSNPAVVTVRIAAPAAIEILRYAPSVTGASQEAVVQGAYRTGPAPAAPFATLPLPRPPGSAAIALPAILPLVAARQVHGGDPLFVRLTDLDQNLDRTARETVIVTLVDDLTGDTEVVRLTEDGPDSGVFVGYVPTVGAPAATSYDGVLQVVDKSVVTARYVDPIDGSDVSAATAGVDPAGKIFDSRTGQPVSGAQVTLIDVATGQPAQVFSDDGVSSFPSTVISGQNVTDGAGRTIAFGPGEFRFPVVRPGTYRYDVRPPSGYSAPSQVATATLQSLPGGPFALVNPGSREEPFAVSIGSAVQIDIPVDPTTVALWVQKVASTERVAVGDLLSYQIDVNNPDRSNPVASVQAVDMLPPGFRYKRGTAQINGAAAADPAVSADGKRLTFTLGTLAPAATASIRFVAQVGAGAQVGTDAVNYASASAPGGAASNLAQARVRVADELFSARSFIVGRVTSGDCLEGEGGGERGVEGIRVLLEDGTFALSDRRGLFHFEGVRRGLHVVQLDPDSLPPGYEPVSCTKNDRFAGRAFSQFVEVGGDVLWRADFHLRAPPPPPGEVGVALSHKVVPGTGGAQFKALVHGTRAPMDGVRLTVTLPPGIAYEPGSSARDGARIADPLTTGQTFAYPLGKLPPKWKTAITFSAHALDEALHADTTPQAVLTGTSPTGAQVATAPASNVVRFGREQYVETLRLVSRPHFPSFGARLSEPDMAELRELAHKLAKMKAEKILVTGHTDSVPIRTARARKIFADNVALSRARAASVARYLMSVLHLESDQVIVDGKGEAEPIADNAREEGRALNRRVEVQALAHHVAVRTALVSVRDKSGPVTAAAPLKEEPVATPEEVASATTTSPAAADMEGDGLMSPRQGDLVADRVGAVQIRLASYLTPVLAVDGKEIDPGRIGYKGEDKKTGKTVYTYVGVDFGEKGTHSLAVTGTDPFGNARVKQAATILRTGEIASIRFIEADGNVADGHTPVRARIELRDASGNLIHGSTRLEIREGTLRPYRREDENFSVEDLGGGRIVPMSGDGTVLFAPVTTSGSYRARLACGGTTVEVETWAQPKMRDWVLVGLAEGTAGYNVTTGNMETLQAVDAREDFYDDGRVAFYAKGQIQGKWLLTMAYDSARPSPTARNGLFQQIDPQTYFTVYGDGGQQGYDASSVRKVYVRLEREQFYALFGDFDTGLTLTELSRYSRRLNGFKTEARTRSAELNAFIARTDQVYARDEIPGDGTSGLYRLSRGALLPNSETVTILTRDRFRSEVIVESRTLTRFTDYSIDYDLGTIFFREPIPSRDFAFNPLTIVVEYELTALAGGDYTLGGRAGVKVLDQALRAGVSAVHEGEGARKNNLIGADVKVQVSDGTTARAEVARTETRDGGTTTASGNALLAEVVHNSTALDGKVYFREQQSGFGLGQQALSESGTRKWGAEGALHFGDHLSLGVQGFRQDTFSTGVERRFGEGRLGYTSPGYGAYVGVLGASDQLADGSHHDSGQLTAGGKLTAGERLTLGIDYSQSVWGDGSVDFPTRVAARVEYKLTTAIALLAAQELTWGENGTTNNTRIGFRSTPWKGASLTSSVERDLNENASRVFGNIGLRQTWQVSDAWKVDAAGERSQTVAQSGYYLVNPAYPPASGNVARQDFTAFSTGATYQQKRVVWDSRAEVRFTHTDRKWSLLSGAVFERDEGWAFSGRGQYLGTSADAAPHTTSFDLRFGLAYRPPQTHFIVLNRLDWVVENGAGAALAATPLGTSGLTASWRVMDNVLFNFRPRKDFQLSLGYGGKYGRQEISGVAVQGYTDQESIELRYDLCESWDVGARGSILHVWTLGEVAYSGGPSVGFSPAKNVWLGIGFNFAGYDDRDFFASNYTAYGPWLRLRFKIDQESVREAAAWLNKQ